MKIVTCLWRRTSQIPPSIIDYTAQHVNILERMLKRHLKIDHELICITDMPEGINCRTIPLWDKCKDLGGCYNRLYMFSSGMKELIGPRFAAIDLDCVITGDVTPIFTMEESFIIHRYVGKFTHQRYNGAFMIMDAGCKEYVWTDFDPQTSPDLILKERDAGRRIGTDQAWISYSVDDAKVVGNEHGIYEAVTIGKRLPKDARMVFFSGRRDPSRKEHLWIRDNYH